MKKVILTILTFISLTVSSFSQSIKVAILLTTGDSTETNYNKTIKNFIMEHLKKLPDISITDYNVQIPNNLKDNIDTDSGKFVNISITKDAFAKGIDKLLLIYYSADPMEIEKTANHVKTVRYYCRINFWIQIIKTTNNQVLNSVQFYGAAGTAIDSSKEYYKTKEEAVKSAIEGSTLTNYTDTKTKNIDNYLKKTLTL